MFMPYIKQRVWTTIGSVKQNFEHKIVIIFLSINLNMFLVSLRWFFWLSTACVLVEKKEK